MKNKALIYSSIIFFLIINTSYYWEGKLGIFSLFVFLLLIIAYLSFTVLLILQLFFAIREKIKNKQRLYSIALVTFVLVFSFIKPNGLIDFDLIEGDNLLIAKREGAANCMTTFKLKENFIFKEKNVCFGVSEVSGTYRISNDTIYFENIKRGKQEDLSYEFGVIEELVYYTELKYALKLFKNKEDTVGFNYFISKNKLNVKPLMWQKSS